MCDDLLTLREAVLHLEDPLGETRDLISGGILAVRLGIRDGLTEEDCQGVVAILDAALRECHELERRWDLACKGVGIASGPGEG